MTKDTSAAATPMEASPVARLVFLDGEGLANLPSREAASVVLAVRTEELALRLAGKGTVLRADLPDFTDRLKLLTGEKGFPEVLVMDRDPEAVRQALGAAGVFGVVRLFFEPSGPVTADLHTTINYKSLVIKGSGFGVQGSGETRLKAKGKANSNPRNSKFETAIAARWFGKFEFENSFEFRHSNFDFWFLDSMPYSLRKTPHTPYPTPHTSITITNKSV